MFLQLPELERERTLRHPADQAPQFTEPLCAVEQIVKDQRLPFAAGNFDGDLNGTAKRL
ncbi:hypothetical protein SAMN05216228_102861 [Rhizobium tibeticum]|uniref:Uncharacterized protein n=1 Tax=Rhizobium tibeticum TaxID=501024 RepID=A0A1H8TEE1_9HYPH|nr:hypothetical protein RTCCBAU85039_5162 [Rhizobium tibeticum]SEO89116.1 hypothetical protein SAMN05216228_102861 [Rhizobium tibeticum]